MGTRADFYIKETDKLTWLGSIAWDGNPESISPELLRSKTEEEFRANLEKFFTNGREDVTRPEQGWPWPWDDSKTTDYAYALDIGLGKVMCWSDGPWRIVPEEITEKIPEEKWESAGNPKFPNMKSIQKVTLGKRSGVMLFVPGKGPIEGLD